VSDEHKGGGRRAPQGLFSSRSIEPPELEGDPDSEAAPPPGQLYSSESLPSAGAFSAAPPPDSLPPLPPLPPQGVPTPVAFSPELPPEPPPAMPPRTSSRPAPPFDPFAQPRESETSFAGLVDSQLPDPGQTADFEVPAGVLEATNPEAVVLEDVDENTPDRPLSGFPPPLGMSEGHDAWTLERMSRQSTVPPTRSDEVDRLRELAQRRSLPPEPDHAGDALDLVDHSRPSQQLDLLGEMEELYALDDLTGALGFAELVLGRDPGNAQALRCAANCRERLIQLYTSKIGDLASVPVHAVGENEQRWLGLDHRAGFLLSRIDGLGTVEDLLDVCGMPRLEALKTLADLLERGAIRLM